MQSHIEVLKQIGTLAARGLSRGELTKQQRIDILRDIERLAKAAPVTISAAPAPAPKRAAREEKEYKPLNYTRTLADGTIEQHEMDGVEVDQRIRKLMAGINARARRDGRDKGSFERAANTAREPNGTLNAEGYMVSFCRGLNHIPATYTNGITA